MSESQALSEIGKAEPHPSATVVLVREELGVLEVLLVQRNLSLSFHGGAWVFPGGRIDESDYQSAAPDDTLSAPRNAAVREAREEVGLHIEAQDLRYFSHWTTPPGWPKRFSTWFFVARAPTLPVRVDHDEVIEYRWSSAASALAARRAGEIELPPPTFVTLVQLAEYPTARALFDALSCWQARHFFPRVVRTATGACSLYEGDAGYVNGDLDCEGRRHRLSMLGDDWRYEDGREICGPLEPERAE